MREVAQGLQLVVEASTPYSAVANGGGPGDVNRQQGQCPGVGGVNAVRGCDAYKRARHGKKSRICNTLKTEKPKAKSCIKENGERDEILDLNNVEEKESLVTIAVKEFENRRHIQADVSESEAQGKDLNCFEVIQSEGAVDNDVNEDMYVKVENVSVALKESIANVEHDSKDIRDDNKTTAVDIDANSENDVDKNVLDTTEDSIGLKEMKTVVKAEVVKVVYKGTFKENSRAIHNYLEVPEIDIDVKEVTSHDVYEENFVDEVSEDHAKKSQGIKLLFEGTFLENLEEIQENLDYCNCNENANERVETFPNPEIKTSDEYIALETLVEVLDKKDSEMKDLPVREAAKDLSELREIGLCLNDEVYVEAEADNAKEMMKIDMNVSQVLNLMLSAVMTVWLILIPIVRLVGNILINLLTCVEEYVYLYPMLAMLDMFLEYGAEVVEKVTKEVKDESTDRSVKLKKTGVCKFCYCLQCDGKTEDTLAKNKDLSKKLFYNLLDRSWLVLYEIKLLDGMPVVQDKSVFLPLITSMDLKEDVVENENASADKIMVF